MGQHGRQGQADRLLHERCQGKESQLIEISDSIRCVIYTSLILPKKKHLKTRI